MPCTAAATVPLANLKVRLRLPWAELFWLKSVVSESFTAKPQALVLQNGLTDIVKPASPPPIDADAASSAGPPKGRGEFAVGEDIAGALTLRLNSRSASQPVQLSTRRQVQLLQRD